MLCERIMFLHGLQSLQNSCKNRTCFCVISGDCGGCARMDCALVWLLRFLSSHIRGLCSYVASGASKNRLRTGHAFLRFLETAEMQKSIL